MAEAQARNGSLQTGFVFALWDRAAAFTERQTYVERKCTSPPVCLVPGLCFQSCTGTSEERTLASFVQLTQDSSLFQQVLGLLSLWLCLLMLRDTKPRMARTPGGCGGLVGRSLYSLL